jgi:two-component system, NtrC family, sensor kinase
MRKPLACCLLSFFLAAGAAAQRVNIDSLKTELGRTDNDTVTLFILAKITDAYSEINFDSVYQYALQMQKAAQKLNLKLEEATALNNVGYALMNKGNFARSLQYLLNTFAIEEDPASEKNILSSNYPPIDEFSERILPPYIQRQMKLSRTRQYAGILYYNAGNFEKALEYYHSSLPVGKQYNNHRMLSITYSTMGRTFLTMKKNDSAFYYLRKAYDYAKKVDYYRYAGSILLNIGRAFQAEKKSDSAEYYFRMALDLSRQNGYFRGVAASNLALAEIHQQTGYPDSNLFYSRLALHSAYDLNAPDLFLRSYRALSDYFKSVNIYDSAVKYQSLVIKINDSIFNSRQAQQFQNIDFDEQQRQQQIEAAKMAYRDKFRLNLLLGGLGLFLIIALLMWRNSLQRKKANILLSRQKDELETTLSTLKATQKQLIQSEKMASLGELTAGIAHEIQNPLNFVNNFSEINTELLAEMKQGIDQGNFPEVKTLADDIIENERKISHHGKRAETIVKGMLQHSRSSSGQNELTDINAMCDEYVRLAYHGLRAKDKSFNADLKTNFDPQAGKINIVPQDIGRVVLNLITNAFYSVNQKRKEKKEGYHPAICVETKRMNKDIEISVNDNGTGISGEILDKIFQPFFTTKPAGHGTGLGLSLSYDIIKAHGGELKVETKIGEGSRFIIRLPS